jgi:ParB family chromosome partitioning protein
MTQKIQPGEIRMIPIDQIDILNSRERNNKIFEEVVENINRVGMKKPISVTPRKGPDGSERFLLICGEGRLKAFKTLGDTQIPALVVDKSDEEAFIMSLVENITKIKRSPLESLADIERLRDNGYGPKEISEKTGLNINYVNGILLLLKQGEERLLVAVERGRIPITAALSIVGAGDDDKAMQVALQEAYETGKLRGGQLKATRQIIERRRIHGRSMDRKTPLEKKKGVSTTSLVRTYQREVERQMLMVKKAEHAQHRLLFIVEALRKLYADENFGNLLRAERLDTLPKYLAERVWPDGSHA